MEIQWSLVLFTALTGAAGWMLCALAIDIAQGKAPKESFKVALIALIIMVVGGCCSVTHLSHPENILGALSHPTSGIFVEAVLVGLSALFTILYLVFAKREGGEKTAKIMIIIGAVFGVVLSFMAGESYMMAAQLTWNTILLPLGYLGTAMATGIALYLVCVLALDKEAEQPAMAVKLLLIGGIVAAVTVVAYAAVSGAFTADAVMAIVALAGAGVVPIVVGAMLPKASGNALMLVAVAAVCALIGAVCYRCMMWDVASHLVDFFNLL